MRNQKTALWLAIQSAEKGEQKFGKSDEAADDFVTKRIHEIAEYAEPLDVENRVVPTHSFWLERFEDSVRIAEKVNRQSVGVTFNLCHWLKVEGAERDAMPF